VGLRSGLTSPHRPEGLRRTPRARAGRRGAGAQLGALAGQTLALEAIAPKAREAAIASARAQLAARLPERIPERLQDLRAEQGALRETLRTYPAHFAARLRTLDETAERARQGAEAAAARLETLVGRLGDLRPWQRQERAELSRRAAHEERVIARLATDERAARAEAENVARGRESPQAWKAAHPGARERYAQIAGEIREVSRLAREVSIARTIASPPEAVLRALGPRPAHPERRPAWDRAVAAIAAYRQERTIADDVPGALGPEPAGGPERAAWRMVSRAAERAAAELGRPLELGILSEGSTRGIEWEP